MEIIPNFTQKHTKNAYYLHIFEIDVIMLVCYDIEHVIVIGLWSCQDAK